MSSAGREFVFFAAVVGLCVTGQLLREWEQVQQLLSQAAHSPVLSVSAADALAGYRFDVNVVLPTGVGAALLVAA